MPAEINGQGIYELFPDCAYTWDGLPVSERAIYIAMAEALNQQYLAPLQGLVRELESTLVYCWNNEFPVEAVEKLQERVKLLLSDEQKEE